MVEGQISETDKRALDGFVRSPLGDNVANYVTELIKSRKYDWLGFDNDWTNFHRSVNFKVFSEPLVNKDNLLEITLKGTQTASGTDHRVIGDLNTWKDSLLNVKRFKQDNNKEIVVLIVEQGNNGAEAIFVRPDQYDNIKDNPLFKNNT